MSVRSVKGLICSLFVLVAIGIPIGNALSAAPASPLAPSPLQGTEEDVDEAVAKALDATLDLEVILDRIDAFTPRFGEEISEEDVIVAWGYLSSELAVLGTELETLGLDTNAVVWVEDESFLVNDFGAFDYAQFYVDECLAISELTDGLYSDPRVYLAAMKATGDPALFEEATTNVVLSKILAVLGVSELVTAFNDVIEVQAGATLKALGKAIQNKNVKAVPKLVKRLMTTMLSEPFRTAVAGKVGKKVAGKAFAKMLGKAVPVVGWAFLAGSILWTFYEQYTNAT